MIVPISQMRAQEISISFRALMFIAEVQPTALPLVLHILAVNMRVPDRAIKVSVCSNLSLKIGFRLPLVIFNLYSRISVLFFVILHV